MKKFILCFLLIIIPTTTLHAEESTWIIEVDQNPHDIKDYIEDYHPLLKVEHVYDTLMDALAVTGDTRHIKALHEEQFVKSIQPVQMYTVPSNHAEPQIHPERARYHPTGLPYTGKGVKVGVIDTGIDYTHPDLEKSFHGGFDVVDFDEDPMETKAGEGMPTLHGTHVSGIIAGNGLMQGVAPDAEIYAYRALGPGGSGTTAQVIAALEQAIKDGMDIINMSLGSNTNSPDDPMTRAVNRAVELGTTVIVANGNSGPEEWTVGSPATSEKAISVGAAITKQEVAQIKTADSPTIPVRQLPLSESWDLKKGYPIAAPQSLKELEPTIHDRIVLIKKGNTPYYELIQQLEEKGATAALIYNGPQDDPNQWEWVQAPFPASYLTEEEANALIQGELWLQTNYKTIKNALAPFSSRGPVASSWNIKPDILAPGVDIVSTIPNGYAALQGTSMASPYVAGVAALLKEAYPHDTPSQIKSRLLSSTKLFETGDQEAPPSEQGTGFIDTKQAINSTYSIENNRLNFGKIDATHKYVNQTITIKNHDREPLNVRFNIPKRQSGIVWDLPMSTTIEPKTSRSFEVGASITPDRLTKGNKEGFIEVELNQKINHLPFLFINKTSDYPRITGFELDMEPFQNEQLTVRFFVNENVEQLKVILIEPKYLRTTEWFTETDVKNGVFEKTFEVQNLPKGEFKAIFQIEQNGETITEEKNIYLPEF
ncbi:S8 family serine peptidase [Filobacillus milosensis]|nr:S8 family serine peptidase [Filobacillus milosensis]